MSAKEIKVLALPIDIQEDATYSIEQPNPNSYTHGFFKYPCKFIPEIPRWAIAKYATAEANSCIYDHSIRGIITRCAILWLRD